MITRCQNNACEFAARCAISRADAIASQPAPVDGAPAALPPPSPTAQAVDPWKAPVFFSVRPSPHGWIGVLDVRGRLEKTHSDLLIAACGEILRVSGLLLNLDTPGGDGSAGVALQAIAAMAMTRMPVVAWARRACSAGILALVGNSASYCSPFAQLGVFGVIRGVCDGKTPRLLVSAQSPRKCPGAAPVPWLDYTYAFNGEAELVQAALNRAYECDLEQLQKHTGTDPRRLRVYMDGRVLTPRQGRRLGLIDGICSQDEAYRELLKMVENSVR